MRMTLYETVKSNVTTLQAAERYGLKVGHGGMCKCPFHNDKNPSMKVDKRFHCFGCQADGDVINFTSRLFDLTPKAAALKLAGDFGIHHNPQQIETAIKKPRMISEKEIFEHKVSFCYQELVSYRNLLVQWQQQYAPKTPDEEWHPLFIHAVHNLETVEQELDTLLSGSDYEKRELVSDHLRKKKNHREDYAMEPTVNVPVYPESAAHARKFGELEQYRKSHFANIDCKKDIEQAISENFDGFRLNKRAAEEIIAKYGPERVSTVLAATVQVKEWDGRFSATNKDWAFTFDFPDAQNDLGFDRRDSYAVTSHPAVLDGFINQVRQDIEAMEHRPEDERKFAVLLTDTQEIKIVECDPQEEMFGIARGLIGCEWIELVEATPLAEQGYLLLIDDEGKMRSGEIPINCIASDLYASDQHGDPIVGNTMIVRAAEEKLELLTASEAKHLADDLVKSRDKAIEKISRAFGLLPKQKTEPEFVSASRRQPCKKNDMER